MRRKLFLVIAFINISINWSHAQDWAPLPLKFNRNPAHYFVDTAEKVMYLGGGFDTVNGRNCQIVKWDGTNATYIRAPLPRVDDVTTFKGNLYVNVLGDAVMYDGTTWQPLTTHYSLWGTFNHAGDKLLMAQYVTDSVTFNVTTSLIAWDGNTWKDSLILDSVCNSFATLAWYKGELYLGGSMYSNNKPLLTNIIRYDGTQWKDVGGGIQSGGLSHVNQLLVWRGDLYVAGEFLEAQGAPGNCIARWDGTSWHRLKGGAYKNGGTEADIQNMVVVNDELYVAGFFDMVDGIPTTGIAKWDGTKWCTVGDYFGGRSVQDLASYKGALYIGGGFSAVNMDTSIRYLAKYTGSGFNYLCSVPTSISNAPPSLSNKPAYPNPANDKVTITHNAISKEARITICDLAGRSVTSKKLDANSGTITLDISALQPGMYIYSIVTVSGVIQQGKIAKQ
jgi:hypothetical protein